jgi:hypothetical protein
MQYCFQKLTLGTSSPVFHCLFDSLERTLTDPGIIHNPELLVNLASKCKTSDLASPSLYCRYQTSTACRCTARPSLCVSLLAWDLVCSTWVLASSNLLSSQNSNWPGRTNDSKIVRCASGKGMRFRWPPRNGERPSPSLPWIGICCQEPDEVGKREVLGLSP